MKHNYRIDYENTTLRPLCKDDIESLRIWRNDQSNVRFLSKIPFITKSMQYKWFETYIYNNDELCFAILENRELNRLVGSLSLYGFSKDSCYFGKILIGDAEAHGRKVGVNATIAASIIAFKQLNLKVIKLRVFTDNIPAIKIYKRAGFIIQGEYKSNSGEKEYLMIKKASEEYE